jgi:Asp-tRNA(Asn)/Glu-tRNA(Gln) amidotransferase B subunit
MRKKSLLETNPYLKDPELRDALIKQFVASSTAIEGVRIKIPKLPKEMKKRLRKIATAQQSQDKGR